VVSAVWAVVQYRDEAAKQRAAQQFEASRPFLQQQLDLCVQASDTAAALASAQDPDRVRAALDRFWQLYLGSLHIVEDVGPESVAGRMVEFGKIVEKLPSDPVALAALGIEQRGLSGGSLSIARACRALIEKSWQAVVPQLRGK
jgi:hypothetical protein